MTISLPTWATDVRPTQVTAIQDILAAYRDGARVVMLDAPTGSGKTLIGDLVRQNLHARTLYLCSSLALQDQFARDFPSSKILKGRSNYPTADKPSDFPKKLSAGDCSKARMMIPACHSCDPFGDDHFGMHCLWCHPITDCGYEQAKREAMRATVVCTNTAYFLHEANYVGLLPLDRQLIIIDEADTLEDQLMSFIEVSVTERKAKEYGIYPPAKKTVESAWIEWALDAEHTLSKYRVTGDSVTAVRSRNSLDRLCSDIARLNDPATGLAAGGWVYTGYNTGHITFKPIEIRHLATEYVWKHAPRFLLMSATTISFDVMAHTLGLDY